MKNTLMRSSLPLKLALLAGLGLTFAGVSYAPPAAAAQVSVGIGVRVGPPPPRFEHAPPPRRGYVWAPGYWDWRHGRYVWMRGSWVRERHGYRYNAPQWHERNGRWYREQGGWARGDRDRDGVPNAFDHRPNNPHRN